jgi:hypothetical protein
MMIFKKAVPRRTFLRGIGTTLALPLLDSMVPAFAAGDTAQARTRLGYFYTPNGRIMKKWTPLAQGAGYDMTPTLEPLAPFRDHFLVLSGLNVKAADARGNEPGGVHARPCASWLTGIHPKPGGAVGVSVDQMVAKEFGKQTPLASLEMGMDPTDIVGGTDGSYAAYYQNTVSWRTGTTPLPVEISPRAVFERLFGDTDSADPAARVARAREDRSVLDSVTQGVARLMSKVGSRDRAKLGEYLDAIRDLERRIEIVEAQTAAPQGAPSMERPAGIPPTFKEHVQLMFDLEVLALQSETTRVVTFMMGREQTDRPYREIGVNDGHHPLSHHKDFPEMIAEVEKIDRYHSEMFAYFLEKMRSTPDGDGSLLDHSIIVYGSALSDGNAHLHNDIPVLLAGGGGGKIKGGRHIRYEGLPFSNLHVSVLDMLNIPVEGYLDREYSDATGKLELLSI